MLMSAPSVAPRPAALLAAASEPMPEVPVIALRSEGVLLIYGRDEKAIEAGDLLRQQMDVTVLIVPPAAAIPVQASDFPVVRGAIRSARGHLGAFEITVDDFAEPTPSSSGTLAFGPARQGAVSRCDVILDLSGGVALFSAPELRDGYVRADPGHPGSVMDAVSKTRHLTGTFDKPRYVAFTEQRCAHGRSQITGCTRCLDLCPAGAISPAGGPCRNRSVHLRRLRSMRRRLPYRCRRLYRSAGRCTPAQATRPADGLSHGGRRTTHRTGAR